MNKRKTKPPILPGNLNDPNGADRLERGAINEFGKRIRRIATAYQDILDRIPASPAVNLRYAFDLDTSLLSMLLSNASVMVDEILFGDSETDFWFWRDYVRQGYQRGTAQEFASLSQQSPVYAAGRESLQQLLLSDTYQRRLLLVRTRVFEEMKNLSARMKSDMARILTDGMGRGRIHGKSRNASPARPGLTSAGLSVLPARKYRRRCAAPGGMKRMMPKHNTALQHVFCTFQRSARQRGVSMRFVTGISTPPKRFATGTASTATRLTVSARRLLCWLTPAVSRLTRTSLIWLKSAWRKRRKPDSSPTTATAAITEPRNRETSP